MQVTGDKSILDETVGNKSVSERLEWAMDFLMKHRFDEKYALIWGATTADWGDVQPEHDWGVYFTDDTHFAIDIYDNAMFIIALDNLTELIPTSKEKWQPIRNKITENCRKYLWDETNQKFIPHIYLNGSPFPDDFNENEIYYHGGTAIAIEAGLLSTEEIKISLDKMIANVKAAGAGSIGLTMYPPYPEGFLKTRECIRTVIRTVETGFEWYTVDNKPKGSGTFRGEAGVLYKAIVMFEEFAKTEK